MNEASNFCDGEVCRLPTGHLVGSDQHKLSAAGSGHQLTWWKHSLLGILDAGTQGEEGCRVSSQQRVCDAHDGHLVIASIAASFSGHSLVVSEACVQTVPWIHNNPDQYQYRWYCYGVVPCCSCTIYFRPATDTSEATPRHAAWCSSLPAHKLRAQLQPSIT